MPTSKEPGYWINKSYELLETNQPREAFEKLCLLKAAETPQAGEKKIDAKAILTSLAEARSNRPG